MKKLAQNNLLSSPNLEDQSEITHVSLEFFEKSK